MTLCLAGWVTAPSSALLSKFLHPLGFLLFLGESTCHLKMFEIAYITCNSFLSQSWQVGVKEIKTGLYLRKSKKHQSLSSLLSLICFVSLPPRAGSQITSPEVVLKRLKALSRNGPLFALSFLAFWVAWARPGLQFLLCLCLYDGFLTMVDLNHNALLADLAVSFSDRTRLNFHCSIFSALGSFSVFLSYLFWDKEDFYSFRIFCVALAAFSISGFYLVSRMLRHRFQKEVQLRQNEAMMLKEYVFSLIGICPYICLKGSETVLFSSVSLLSFHFPAS